jgi:hypothetical protein
MRRILVDYARQRGAAKRGDGAIHEPLEEGIMVSNQPMSAQQSELIINMDEALTRLEKINPPRPKWLNCDFLPG